MKNAIERRHGALPGVADVKDDPASVVQIRELDLALPVLCVRPLHRAEDYCRVRLETAMLARTTSGDVAQPVPETRHRVQQRASA